MEVRSHGSHTWSFFTLAPRTRNNHTGHRNHEKADFTNANYLSELTHLYQ